MSLNILRCRILDTVVSDRLNFSAISPLRSPFSISARIWRISSGVSGAVRPVPNRPEPVFFGDRVRVLGFFGLYNRAIARLDSRLPYTSIEASINVQASSGSGGMRAIDKRSLYGSLRVSLIVYKKVSSGIACWIRGLIKSYSRAALRGELTGEYAMTPKRTWKMNIYGNVVGFEGARRVEEFGCQPWSERWAMAWANGMSREDAESYALNNPNFRDSSKERK